MDHFTTHRLRFVAEVVTSREISELKGGAWRWKGRFWRRWALPLILMLALGPGAQAEDIGSSQEQGAYIIRKILIQHMQAGDRYLEEKKLDEAIVEYQKALQIAPNELHARMNLGIIYQEKQMWDQAIAEYEKAIASSPDLAAAHNNLGLVYWKKGRHQEAIAALKRTISLEPTNANGHANLGTVYTSMGMLPEAIAAYQKALEIAPDLVMARKSLAIAHGNLGIGHYNAGRHGEAIAELKRARELDPEFVEVQALLEQIEKGRAPEAGREAMGPAAPVAADPSFRIVGELKPWEAAIGWGKESTVERPFVEILLNGKHPERFLIDSRTPYIAIAQDLFQTIQGGPEGPGKTEKTEKSPEPAGPKGRRAREASPLRREYRVSLDSLQVGALSLKNVPALAVLALPERGILGLSVLGQLGLVRLDLDEGRLSFRPYEGAANAGEAWQAGTEAGETVIPFSNFEGAILLEIRVNDRPCKALIDTRSASTVISSALLRELGLKTKFSAQSQDLRGIAMGSRQGAPAWRIVQGKVTVQVGSEELPKNWQGDLLSYEIHPSDVDVILGMPHLKGLILTLDYRSQRVRLTRSRKGKN